MNWYVVSRLWWAIAWWTGDDDTLGYFGVIVRGPFARRRAVRLMQGLANGR